MKLPRPLKCADAGKYEILRAMLMHELDEEDEDRLLRHIKNCPSCLSVMASVLSETRKFVNGESNYC